MSVEVHSYRLALRGKPVGTHVVKTALKGQHAQLEARSQFQGQLGVSTVVQRSRCHAVEHFSLRFNEETQERSEQRKFDVTFDGREGLVTASKGGKDNASIPYLLPYRDPLSLLHELRSLSEQDSPQVVPMLGKDVTVQFAGEVELDTALGRKRARAYVLHPGQSVVYVDVAEPHAILKLTQRLLEGQLEVLLVKVGSEAALEPFGEAEPERGRGKSGRKRGQRRRPRRRKKS